MLTLRQILSGLDRGSGGVRAEMARDGSEGVRTGYDSWREHRHAKVEYIFSVNQG